MATDDQSRSRLSPSLSNQLQPTTPPCFSSSRFNTYQNTEKPVKPAVSWRRRDGSRTPRAIFDVENGKHVEISRSTEAMSRKLQQIQELLSDSRKSRSGQDWKRRAARRLVDNEVDLSPGPVVKKKIKTETSKIGLVTTKSVQKNNTGKQSVLQRATSSQVGLTLEHLSPALMKPPKLFCDHTSQLADGVKNENTLPPEPTLPTVYSSNHPDLNVITPKTVAEVLRGDYEKQLGQYKLLDCRFPYEFKGGSLTGAISSCDPENMEMQLFMSTAIESCIRTSLIFFCEFSANRAPKMLRHVRNVDRSLHVNCYPELYYPELYLIDGGYKNCFETYQHEICAPLAMYVAMEDKRFTEACRHEFATWRRRWKRHKIVANCTAKLSIPLQMDRHNCHQVRSIASGVRSLFDEL